MLVFLNIDCLVRQVSAAAGTAAGEPLGVPAFESVLDAWPRLRHSSSRVTLPVPD